MLGDAKRYFFAASELLGISRLSQEGKQMDRIGAQLKNSKDDNVSVAMRAFGSGIGVAGRAIKTAMQKLERFFDEQETLLTLGVPYTILKEIKDEFKGILNLNAESALWRKGLRKIISCP